MCPKSGKIINVVAAIIGYLLSPLSWWNDLFINIPLAYLLSLPFSMMSEKIFPYAFVIGYWLTNLAGILLMQKGVFGIISSKKKKWDWKNNLLISLIYTIVIILLVRMGCIRLPSSVLNK